MKCCEEGCENIYSQQFCILHTTIDGIEIISPMMEITNLDSGNCVLLKYISVRTPPIIEPTTAPNAKGK